MSLLTNFFSVLSGGVPYYHPVANSFSGSSGFNKISDFTGNIAGKQGICNFWIKPSVLSGVTGFLQNGMGNIFIGTVDAAIHIYGATSLGLQVLGLDTSTNLSLNVWNNVLMSWDLSANYAKLYINDVYSSSGLESHINQDLDYSDGGWTLNESSFAGCMSEFYFATNQFLDITVEANRRKFISADLKPVSLGTDGSLPTGTAPIYYMKQNGSNRLVNSGSGGNFDSITGTVTDCSDAPG